VDTLTLSIEQKTLAEERIKKVGLEDCIRVHLLDYRKIPAEFEKAFDAFVSIEMIEVSPPVFFGTLFHEKSPARWPEVLQHLLPTGRLCSQVERCYGCHHIFDPSRIQIY